MANRYPEPYKGDQKYVFISYSHSNKDIVYEDIQKLKEMGVRIWYDKGIPAGPEWDKFVYPKIVSDQCALVLFYVSEAFFFSDSIIKEIKTVFNVDDTEKEVKPSFSVNVGGISALKMLLNAQRSEDIKEEKIKLVIDYFGDKRIFIKREENSDNHIEEIAKELIAYDVIDERLKEKLIKRDRTYDIIFIGKDSVFTNSLKSGIQTAYSKMSDVNFNAFLINTKHIENPDEEVIRLIEDNQTIIDGLLLRPIHGISKKIVLKIEELIKSGIKVMLMDKDLNDTQKKSFKYALPAFLGSDFTQGGKILGERIIELIDRHKNDNYKIILLDGPKDILSAETRVRALKLELFKSDKDVNTTSFIIESFDVEKTIFILEQKFHSLFAKEKHLLGNTTVYVYLANDNITKSIIKVYRSQESSYIKSYLNKAKNVVFIGYDGIKDIKGDIDLFNYDANVLTMDVMPAIQGKEGAEMMMEILTDNPSRKSKMLKPNIREKINVKPMKGKTIINIHNYIKDKKLMVFDLDGTIANTEILHFNSYKKLLNKLGIDFTLEDFERYVGNSEKRIWTMINSDYTLSLNIEEMLKQRTVIVKSLIDEGRLHTYEYFKHIVDHYPQVDKVILSSQIPEVIFHLLKKWGLSELFTKDKVFSVSDESYTKKEVLQNLKHFYHLNDSTHILSDVVLFEDSNKYLKEAKNLGMTAIGIEHQFNCRKLVDCDFILNEELSSGLFIGLAGIDIVHYQNQKMPDEDTKSKTDDFEVFVGGPAANAAITFSQLGGDATLLCCVGESEMGKALKGMLKRYGVTVIDASREESTVPNISSVIVNKTNGSRTIISGQKANNDLEYCLEEGLIQSMDFVLYDGNTPKLFEANSEYMKKNELVIDAGSYKEHLPMALELANVVISSEKFKIDKKNIIDLHEHYQLKFSAITNGAHAIHYKVNDKDIDSFEPKKIEKVVDTLGAGDVLHGAFCYYYYQEKLDLIESLKKAADYSSESVKQRGIIMKGNNK